MVRIFTLFQLFSVLLVSVWNIVSAQEVRSVQTGADVLIRNRLELVKGKRLGIVTNQTGILSNASGRAEYAGRHLVDILSSISGVTISAVFAPEHGFRGEASAGARITSSTDERTGIPIRSIYGSVNKPTPEMLQDVDVIVYDIMDVGARFYTYISTLGMAMEAAAENGKPFIVLDRPNPITGTIVEGPILKPEYRSFVGEYPIPIRYGMTPGELARMIQGEQWMKAMDKINLTVIPMEGWRRNMWFDETGLPWVRPSPNIPSLLSAELYPGMCLIEGLNVSEGRGTMHPFEVFGAPWIDAKRLEDSMNGFKLPGIHFNQVSFTPASIPGTADRPKFQNIRVNGLELIVTDRNSLRPLQVIVQLMAVLRQLHPDSLRIGQGVERLAGTDALRTALLNNTQPADILQSWEKDIADFLKKREKYLLYK